MDNPTAVIGGTGRLGRIVVQRLLDRGEQVRVIGRGRRRARQGLPPGAVFRRGDVRDGDAMASALADCSAIVFCVEPGTDDTGPDRPEATMHIGVRNVLSAATAAGGRPHLVLVSQLHVTHEGHPLNAYGRLLDWRLAGEEEVRRSPLPYTVIRPGWLHDGPSTDGGVRLEQGDYRDGLISRHDLAEACVQALHSPNAQGVTFEIFNETGAAASPDWDGLFAALRRDRALVT